MRLNWRHLPPRLRKTAASIAIARGAIAGFLALIIISVSQSISNSTPAEFFDRMLTMNTVLAVLVLLVSPVLLTIWSMRTAPRFIDEYARMMEPNADEIRRMFVERGLADVFAPWIMTRPGWLRKLGNRLAGRLAP